MRGLLLALAVPLILTACAAPEWGPPAVTEQRSPAEQAFAAGDYRAAAEAWQQAAAAAGPAEASGLRVRAAEAWLLAGEPAKARGILQRVERAALDRADRARLELVMADLALRRNRPDEAQPLLERARPGLPADARAYFDSLYREMERQLASPTSRDLVGAMQLIEGMGRYDPDATVEVLRILEGVGSAELALRSTNPRADRRLAGWLDLALVIRGNLVAPEGVTEAVAAWKARHPYHLLSESQALDAWLQYRQGFVPPRKVAVLVPGSGRLQAAGAALRDGLLSAYLEDSGGAEIQFFATDDSEQSVIAAYFSALDAGADWIIGPLRRESIESVLGLPGMATPLLALNDLPAGFTPPDYLSGQVAGISLSQTAEAAAVARRALASGYRNAILIAPAGEWGERMASAFQADFLQEGGEIVADLRYPEAQNDHTEILKRALKIDQSEARARQLERTLQQSVEFEPTRRSDVDVILLAAAPDQARLIRPQLRFHEAGDIPVFATGRVYSGQPDPARNRDLNGLRFAATPWQLEHAGSDELPDLESLRAGTLGSLFAIGHDAWKLLPWLALMQRDPGFLFPGQSGTYQRAGNSPTLQREPAWAVFRGGRAERLPNPPLDADGGQLAEE